MNSVYVGRGSGNSLLTRGSPEYGSPESRMASYSAHEKPNCRLDALALTAAQPLADASLVLPIGPCP